MSGVVRCGCLEKAYMKPIGALVNGIRACLAQGRKVGGENRGRDNGGGGHDGGSGGRQELGANC